MRLFAAIALDAPLRAALAQRMELLRAQGLEGNFVRPENLHLTLAFIGETQRAEAAAACLSAVRARAFSLALSVLGRFRRKNGDIYYAGVQPEPALSDLAAEVTKNLCAAGFRLEERRFVPHITLCRARSGGREPDFMQYAYRPLFGGMYVDRLVLMQSRHVEGRLVYTPLHQKMLRSSMDGEEPSRTRGGETGRMES